MDEAESVDKRTFDAFVNCEPLGSPSLEEKLRLGPLPKVHSFENCTVELLLIFFRPSL